MGDADLNQVTFSGSRFEADFSFEMDGRPLEAHISGSIDGGQIDGSISLQNAQPLLFSGSRAA